MTRTLALALAALLVCGCKPHEQPNMGSLTLMPGQTATVGFSMSRGRIVDCSIGSDHFPPTQTPQGLVCVSPSIINRDSVIGVQTGAPGSILNIGTDCPDDGRRPQAACVKSSVVVGGDVVNSTITENGK